jgi:hypothetical protein
MGELRIGARREIRLVSRVETLTSEGTTALNRGSINTSSNVSPVPISLSCTPDPPTTPPKKEGIPNYPALEKTDKHPSEPGRLGPGASPSYSRDRAKIKKSRASLPMAAPDIFSVPRRFDMATLLVAMTGFSLLFTGMYLIEPLIQVGPLGMAIMAGLFVAVTMGQAVVIDGGDPRIASIIAGGLYWFAVAIFLGVLTQHSRLDACFLAAIVIFGPVAGYLAGTLVGGVFLIAFYLREWGVLSKQKSRIDTADDSPWHEPQIASTDANSNDSVLQPES